MKNIKQCCDSKIGDWVVIKGSKRMCQADLRRKRPSRAVIREILDFQNKSLH